MIGNESRGEKKAENRDVPPTQDTTETTVHGVFAWGSNTGRVAAPDHPEETVIKVPTRIPWFDGKVLRDVKLDRHFGAAIDINGDLIQWGTAYKQDIMTPEVTLQGRNLDQLCLSKNRILARSRDGRVYSVPVSHQDQEEGSKPTETSWIFWNWISPIAYREIKPKLETGERVTSIAGGLEHALLLTSKGRVFSMASASDVYPSRGQLGVPGLTWLNRPEGPFDAPHELTSLRDSQAIDIACGDYHSLVLDKEGRVFSWGDNTQGQLGFNTNVASSIVNRPSLLPTQKLYTGPLQQLKGITQIAAGGSNSYIAADSVAVEAPGQPEWVPRRRSEKVTADTFAFGSGILGALGNNRWTHMQSTPTKIPSLSSLFEYDEQSKTTFPIRPRRLSVGATHAAVTMPDMSVWTHGSRQSIRAADVLFWGGNEHYQLGTGKRNNVSCPAPIAPLDQAAELQRAQKSAVAEQGLCFRATGPKRMPVQLHNGPGYVVCRQHVECGRHVTCVFHRPEPMWRVGV